MKTSEKNLKTLNTCFNEKNVHVENTTVCDSMTVDTYFLLFIVFFYLIKLWLRFFHLILCYATSVVNKGSQKRLLQLWLSVRGPWFRHPGTYPKKPCVFWWTHLKHRQ